MYHHIILDNLDTNSRLQNYFISFSDIIQQLVVYLPTFDLAVCSGGLWVKGTPL